MGATLKYNVGDSDIRPWGCWEVLATGDGFVIKKIVVNPGERLSLQSHEHRSEHWTVLSGQADVTLGDDIVKLESDGAIFIPRQVRHRIHNTGKDVLSFIEIQTGAVLDENDITRYEDQYGRK